MRRARVFVVGTLVFGHRAEPAAGVRAPIRSRDLPETLSASEEIARGVATGQPQ